MGNDFGSFTPAAMPAQGGDDDYSAEELASMQKAEQRKQEITMNTHKV
jgi:hypothetical protein